MVKFVVLGDVKGDWEYLETTLNYLHTLENGPYSTIFCIGDFFGYRPDAPALKTPVDLYIADSNACHPILSTIPDGGAIGYRMYYLGMSGSKDVGGLVVSYHYHHTEPVISSFSNQTDLLFSLYAPTIFDTPCGSKAIIDLLMMYTQPQFIFTSGLVYTESLPININNKDIHYINLSPINNTNKREYIWYYNMNIEHIPNNYSQTDFNQVYQNYQSNLSSNEFNKRYYSYDNPNNDSYYNNNNNNSNYDYMYGQQEYSHYGNSSSQYNSSSSRGSKDIPPDSYLCKICHNKGHYIVNCPQYYNPKQMANNNPPPKSYGGSSSYSKQSYSGHNSASSYTTPTPSKAANNCWFCVANPNLQKHLLLSMGYHFYLAHSKSTYSMNNLLLVPIVHSNSFVEILASRNSDVINEYNLYVSKLMLYLNSVNSNLIVFERYINRGKIFHAYKQIIEIPKDKDILPIIHDLNYIDKCNFSDCTKVDLVSYLTGKEYYLLEFYEKLELKYRFIQTIDGPYNVNIGKIIVGYVLEKPELISSPYSLTVDEETNMATKFKQAFERFDPVSAGND